MGAARPCASIHHQSLSDPPNSPCPYQSLIPSRSYPNRTFGHSPPSISKTPYIFTGIYFLPRLLASARNMHIPMTGRGVIFHWKTFSEIQGHLSTNDQKDNNNKTDQ